MMINYLETSLMDPRLSADLLEDVTSVRHQSDVLQTAGAGAANRRPGEIVPGGTAAATVQVKIAAPRRAQNVRYGYFVGHRRVTTDAVRTAASTRTRTSTFTCSDCLKQLIKQRFRVGKRTYFQQERDQPIREWLSKRLERVRQKCCCGWPPAGGDRRPI